MADLPLKLRKRGFIIVLRGENNVLYNDTGTDPLVFKTREEAEAYIENNNLNAYVK